jgi:hypothetical protein
MSSCGVSPGPGVLAEIVDGNRMNRSGSPADSHPPGEWSRRKPGPVQRGGCGAVVKRLLIPGGRRLPSWIQGVGFRRASGGVTSGAETAESPDTEPAGSDHPSRARRPLCDVGEHSDDRVPPHDDGYEPKTRSSQRGTPMSDTTSTRASTPNTRTAASTLPPRSLRSPSSPHARATSCGRSTG